MGSLRTLENDLIENSEVIVDFNLHRAGHCSGRARGSVTHPLTHRLRLG